MMVKLESFHQRICKLVQHPTPSNSLKPMDPSSAPVCAGDGRIRLHVFHADSFADDQRKLRLTTGYNVGDTSDFCYTPIRILFSNTPMVWTGWCISSPYLAVVLSSLSGWWCTPRSTKGGHTRSHLGPPFSTVSCPPLDPFLVGECNLWRRIVPRVHETCSAYSASTATRRTCCHETPMQAKLDGTLVVRAKRWLQSLQRRVKPQETTSNVQEQATSVPNAMPTPTVLVFGATGRLGNAVVRALEADGRHVRAAVRSKKEEDEGFGAHVDVLEGIDLAHDAWKTREEELFQGIQHVVWAAGPRRGPGEATSEAIDYQAVETCASLARKAFPEAQEKLRTLLPLESEEDLKQWERLDDVIMGGSSASGWTWSLATRDEKRKQGGSAVWSGTLITQGGGFCGTRTRMLAAQAEECDGIALRVRGDGKRFKVNVKTQANADRSESTYQAAFNTVEGEWTDIRLPWESFVPVRKSRVDASLPPLDPSYIHSIGLVMSKFEFNGMLSGNEAGKFSLELSGGIQAYIAPKPQFVIVSSAGVERNAVVTEEERKNEMPIVQLNPGGILNWKYKGEMAVRGSGLAYTVVRPTGLNEDEEEPCLLEAQQGDRIMGKISREEVAEVVVAALRSPEAVNKTFELRRGESGESKGKRMSSQDMFGMFSSLVRDFDRPSRGLYPLPTATDPPPPPTPERVQEILNDPRVQARMEADRPAPREVVNQ